MSIRRRSHHRPLARSLARSSSSGYLSPSSFRCSSSSLAIYAAAVVVATAQVSRVESSVPRTLPSCRPASHTKSLSVGRGRRRRAVGGRRRRLDRRTARGAVKARSVRRETDRRGGARGRRATTATTTAAAAVSCRAITRIREQTDGRAKPSPPSSPSSSSSSPHGRTGSLCGKVNHRGGRSQSENGAI